MKENQNAKAIYLKDYTAPEYVIDKTGLSFFLHPGETIVRSELELSINSVHEDDLPELVLDGVELTLLSVAVNGKNLAADQYQVDEESLRLKLSREQCPDGKFSLSIENSIQPENNTALEGLYLSKGMYCTQCEAHGFRRITYYLDRPDVMSVFDVYVEADQQTYPVLLSNGNCVDQGVLDNGRHWKRWQDPFRKPCYLFALVAGNLECVEDEFIRASGKPVKLQIFVEQQDLDKCEHAMQSLKNAMKWDEDVFGREYDLDVYMIVAVNHFNMGAMENKGLNIFNTSCVLANQQTTTDMGFERVEAVVAHEYFHNWSGNRVTCRDWFQLSLKEGFTVFRDEEFSSDMGSRTVKRIDDVNILRNFQFKEDAGPMAHPVRPASYIEMNNFYTVTVYNKGAEVVRMLHTLLGPEQFRQSCDLYFDRFDGQAVTCDDFVQCMEDVSAIELTQFKRWYSQAGTPVVSLSSQYDARAKSLRLDFSQSCPATPGQAVKEPFVIPVAFALFAEDGHKMSFTMDGKVCEESLFVLNDEKQSLVLQDVASEPLLSVLRNFSAPVKLKYTYTPEQLAFLMARDDDGFNAWDAGQRLYLDTLMNLVSAHEKGRRLAMPAYLKQAIADLLADRRDPALLARMLTLPSKAYLAEQYEHIHADAIIAAHNFLEQAIASEFRDAFLATYQAQQTEAAYAPEAGQIAQRSLRNLCLRYLSLCADDDALALAVQQFDSASNMTDQSAALRALVNFSEGAGLVQKERALKAFHQQWQHEALVVDQWFSIQAMAKQEGLLEVVQSLMAHPQFDMKNPNRVRALLAAFAQNYEYFHAADGSAYAWFAGQIKELDAINPQVAARMASSLVHWRRYQGSRGEHMKAQLQALRDMEKVSRDVYEIVDKALT